MLVLSLIGEFGENIYSINEKISLGGLHKLIIDPSGTKKEIEKVEYFNRTATKLFYYNQIEYYNNEGNLKGIQAVESLLAEFVSNLDISYEILVSDDVTEGSGYREKFRYHTISFVKQNLMYRENYDLLFDNKQSGFINKDLKYFIDITGYKLSNFITSIIKSTFEIQDHEFINYNHLLNYILVIISFEWFLKYTKEEKIVILNKDYSDYNIDSLCWVYLEERMKFNSNTIKEDWKLIFHQLHKHGYTVPAIRFLNKLMKKREFFSKKDHEIISIKLCELLIDSRNYKKALKFITSSLQDQYKNKAKIAKSTSVHFSIIKLEILIKLNRLTSADKVEKSIKNNIKKLKQLDQVIMLELLSKVYRKTSNYQKEREQLKLISDKDLNITPSSVLIRLEKILDVIINYKSIDPLMKNSDELLLNMDVAARVAEWIVIGINGLNSFNFRFALGYFNRINKQMRETKIKALHDGFVENLSYIGLINLYLKDYKKAEYIFSEILSEDTRETQSENLYASSLRDNTLYLIVLFINNASIPENLQIYFSSLNDIGKAEFIRTFIRFYPEYAGLENVTVSIDKIQQFLDYDKIEFFTDFGMELSENGFSELGIKYFENALNIVKSAEKRSRTLVNIGSVWANLDDHEQAIRYYKDAINIDPENPLAYGNIASSYAYLLNFEKANEKITMALNKLKPNFPNYEVYLSNWTFEKEYSDTMKQNYINFNKIPKSRGEIRKIIRTGDYFYRSLSKLKETELFDASPVFTAYFRALEKILDLEVVKPFINKIRNENLPDLPPEIQNSTKDSFSIKSIYFNEKKSLAPGQWKYLLSNVDVLNGRLIEYIKNNFTEHTPDIIKKVCSSVIDSEKELKLDQLRNDLSHGGSIDFSIVDQNRHLVIKALNSIIDAIFPDYEV